jgi:hypothetical protein
MTKHRFAIATGALMALAAPAFAGQGAISTAVAFQAPCGSYTVVSGDTLGDIAVRETGTRAATDIIYRMNAHKLSSPHDIMPGMSLAMPCSTDLEAGLSQTSPDKSGIGTWNAAAGDFLVPVLTEWGEKAGYNVIVEQNSDWRFGVPYSQNGSLRAAVDDVINGFATAATPPVVVFYTNNVMTIGVR